MGVTLYKLVTGKMPFWSETKTGVIEKINECKLKFPKHCSP
jgi:hypothetical protein